MNNHNELQAHFEIVVTNEEAISGHIRCLMVDNEQIMVKIPENTKSGDRIIIRGKGNKQRTSGIRGDLILTIVIEEEKAEYTKQQDLKRPLSEVEIRALNRVGLNPQSLQRTLDDYIRMYLLEKIEVDVSPASSKDLVGSTSAAFSAGFASAVVRDGAIGVGTALTTGNIKKQTGVQEWIHWKKYALESTDFEKYKSKEIEKNNRILEEMTKYIRSRKGEICCKYEESRTGMKVRIGIATYLTLGIAYIVVLIAKAGNDDVTVVEWLIQKFHKLTPFSNVRPRGSINEHGELDLEY
jgi:hypothetical protein